MPDTKTNRSLAHAFAELSKAAARRKVYSRKAAKDGRAEVAHFLRAMSASEKAQARRLFNSLIGKVDTSKEYVTTLFENEVQNILEAYSDLIDNATAERPALLPALTQLRAAETRLLSFYSQDSNDIYVNEDAGYYVCQFCGYLSVEQAPKKCPICGASKDAFHEVN